nr:MAG TPA: hypothetical protein [Bacteriophage sp.]
MIQFFFDNKISWAAARQGRGTPPDSKKPRQPVSQPVGLYSD